MRVARCGQFCDGAETCHAIDDCRPGASFACDDGVSCTEDSCDEAGDTCSHVPADANCDNGLFCDGVETCDAIDDCETTTPPIDCDDGVDCTVDSCNESTSSCTHTANDALCNDGTLCNGTETCDTLDGCRFGRFIDCSDDFRCSTNTCNAATGVCESDFSACSCGDGEITDIEECEPPDIAGTFEDCNNSIDDDGDGDIDCRDLDCAPGAREAMCDEHCTLDSVCNKFKRDPGLVRYDHPRGHDYFRLHARFPIDPGFDPATQVITFELANEFGAIYRTIVPPGILVSNKNGKRYKFKDKTASTLGPDSFVDGIAKFSFIKRSYEGLPHATFRIRVFGDFLAATKVTMTSQISVGTATASLTSNWKPKRKKWKLPLNDF